MEKDSTQYGVVMVTAASRAEAETIAKALLEAKLAACITLLPVHSIYTWQGEVEQNEEWQLLIKTNLTQFSALEAKVREIHSYQVPEIIALPIAAGSGPYLQWLAENLR
ncbi:MAG: divalent-cation tolerance protein CutA [Oscillatoria princeps RMCB-10]|jgi:periplasmic divalent cation tolerance protein|nr:divalent-cation tolerance protein CutA [Oscillatoria princeps RMCB-10]